jgi:putative tricarboxylic transport membrane protein
VSQLPDTPDHGRRPDRAALVIAVALAGASLLIYWDAARLGGAGAHSRIGPTAFPYAISAAMAVLAVATAVKAWRGGFPPRERDDIPPVLWIVGGLAAQLLLLKVAGFSIATGVLFAATARGLGRGPLWLTFPLGVVLSLGVWLVFAGLLQLSLPAGPLEQLIR